MKKLIIMLGVCSFLQSFGQSLPPKQVYPFDVKQIHSGHSLTDPLFGAPWPGQYKYLLADILNVITWDHAEKSTIPGSPMFWRWNNEQGLNPSARHHIRDWELLVITEGIPIPQHWQTGLITDANEYLSLYVNNAWENGNNGNGAATLLWTTWTNIDDSDGPWRQTLDEYELFWEEMMDYANNHRPSGATPVYIIPGHRMMGRLYDDIQLGLVPDITSIDQFFSDNIHVNDFGSYAMAMIHYACIYNLSPVGLPHNLFHESNLANHTPPSPELANYLQTMIWEVVTSYERTGISGLVTANTALSSAVLAVGVYPNPADSFVQIVGVGTGECKLYDINSQLIATYALGETNKIDVSALNRGLYLLEITTNDVAVQRKIAIE